MDNIKSQAGVSFDQLLRETRDRNRWNKIVRGADNTRIEDGRRQDNVKDVFVQFQLDYRLKRLSQSMEEREVWRAINWDRCFDWRKERATWFSLEVALRKFSITITITIDDMAQFQSLCGLLFNFPEFY